jgi:hypothetical protein
MKHLPPVFKSKQYAGSSRAVVRIGEDDLHLAAAYCDCMDLFEFEWDNTSLALETDTETHESGSCRGAVHSTCGAER